MTITREVAFHLGYTIDHHYTTKGKRFFVRRNGPHRDDLHYGRGYIELEDALKDVETRAAYRLDCTVEQLRDHAVRVLGAKALTA